MTPLSQFTASLLRASSRPYAQAAVRALGAKAPELLEVELPRTFASPLQDTEVRILQLAAAIDVDRPGLFAHALAWYKVALHHRGVPESYLARNVAAIGEALAGELPPSSAALLHRHIAEGLRQLDAAPVELPSHLSKQAPHGELAIRFLLANLESRGEDALDLLRAALRGGVTIAELHDHVLVPAQREVGRMWQMAEIPIADEHYGSGVVDRALWLLQDHIPRPSADAPRVLTMGVGGNLHDFGLRLIAQRLQLTGCAVHHLGANMPSSDIEWALHDRRVDLVAIGATMAIHLHALRELIDAVRQVHRKVRPAGPRLPILVGGEVFRIEPDLHLLVGADASACDAGQATAAADRLIASLA